MVGGSYMIYISELVTTQTHLIFTPFVIPFSVFLIQVLCTGLGEYNLLYFLELRSDNFNFH